MDKKILIVDDAKEITDTFAKLIEMKLGMAEDSVRKAYHGKEAFEICQKESFDLIITDIDMEPMNGVEFIKALKTNSLHQNKPIFIMTGYSLNDEYASLSDCFFNKPVDLKVFIEEINNALKS